jgi:hypothetical protein
VDCAKHVVPTVLAIMMVRKIFFTAFLRLDRLDNHACGEPVPNRVLSIGGNARAQAMFQVKGEEIMKTIIAATIVLLVSGSAFAQSPGATAGGNSKAGGPAATLPTSAAKGGGGHFAMHMHARRHHR